MSGATAVPDLRGRTALVTGAAGAGCGKAIARRLAELGASVAITDSHARRTSEVAATIAAENPERDIMGEVLDAGDLEAIPEVCGRIEERLGPISILVNNAAIHLSAPIADYPLADWRRMMTVNVEAPFALTQHVLQRLPGRGVQGSVVNMSSTAATSSGGGLHTAFSVTKAALNALTRCCAFEGGAAGIRVNAIAMHVVEGTKFADTHPEALKPGVLGRNVQVRDVVDAVVFLVSDHSMSITGQVLEVTAGNSL